MNLSELTTSCATLELDDDEVGELHARLEALGIELTDDCGRAGVAATTIQPHEFADVDDRRAAALPQRARPLPAAHRGRGDRARQAHRARRPRGQGADDPLQPAPRRLDREEVPGRRPAAARPHPGGHLRARARVARSSTGARATSSRRTRRSGSARRSSAASRRRRARSASRSTSASASARSPRPSASCRRGSAARRPTRRSPTHAELTRRARARGARGGADDHVARPPGRRGGRDRVRRPAARRGPAARGGGPHRRCARRRCAARVARLPEVEQQVVKLRYGINGGGAPDAAARDRRARRA